MNQNLPSKESIIKELVAELSSEELVDSKALAIIKLLYRHDKGLAIDKAIEMRNDGRNRLAINAFFLKIQGDDNSIDSEEMIDLDEY